MTSLILPYLNSRASLKEKDLSYFSLSVVFSPIATRGATPTKEPIPDFNDEPSYDPVRSDLIRSEIRGKEYLGAVVRALNFVVYEAAAPLNWEGAKAECAKKGGALASLTYDADIKKLMKYALNGNAWAGAWVGAKNPTKTQTTWRW